MSRQTLNSICLAVGLVIVAWPQASQAQIRLERKLQEEGTYNVEETGRIDQKLTIAGMEVNSSSDSKTAVTTTTGKRDAQGMLPAESKVRSLQVTVAVNGLNYSFDSTNPDNKGTSPLEMIRDIHKGIVRRTTTSVFDKSNRITEIKSDEDTLGSLSAELQSVAKSQLDPERAKIAANEELDQINSDPLNKGDAWQRTKTTNLGSGQVMDFKTEYTYQGTVEKNGKTFDKITSKILSVNFALEDSPLPFTLKSSDLKAAESDGEILFDRERGQTVESRSSIRITGDIVFLLNGNDLPAKLDLKMDQASIVK